MASVENQKKGLTKLGWLLVGGAAAFFLSSRGRREKALAFTRDLAAKLTPGESTPTAV